MLLLLAMNQENIEATLGKIDTQNRSIHESLSTKFDRLVSRPTLSMRASISTRCAQDTVRPVGARQGERGITIFGTSSSAQGDFRIHLSLCLPIIIQGDLPGSRSSWLSRRDTGTARGSNPHADRSRPRLCQQLVQSNELNHKASKSRSNLMGNLVILRAFVFIFRMDT